MIFLIQFDTAVVSLFYIFPWWYVTYRAVVWLCQRGKTGEVYNLVDDGNTTQGLVTNIVSDIFDINHDYWGNTLSKIAKVSVFPF